MNLRKPYFWDVFLAILVGVLLASARAGGLFYSARLSSTDFLHGDTLPDSEIIIVAIDDLSIAQYGAWPWPHNLHAQLIEKLSQARVVGVDILFDEVDDLLLVDAVEKSGNVILASVGILSENAPPGIIASQAILAPPPDLKSAAVGTGLVNAIPDSDGVIRKVPLIIQQEGQIEDALSLQLLRTYLDLSHDMPEIREDGILQADSLQIPVDSWGRMGIHFVGEPNTFFVVSYIDVLSGAVPPTIFKDKIVLVGQMGITGGSDVHLVPTSRNGVVMAGVEVQANIIHTILHQQFLQEQSLLSDTLVILVMSLLGGLILFRLRFWWGIPVVLLVAIFYLFYAFSLFDRGILPDLLYPFLSLGFSYVVAIGIDNVGLFRDLHLKHNELIHAYDSTLHGWARALELRDYETKGHSVRVTEMTSRLAESMGIKGEELVHIRRGAILHDIGKIGISDNLLLKPGKLQDAEWEIMRQHPRFGYDMLLPTTFLKPSLDIVICHHEKWDGTGYPEGLKGEAIPLAARIFSVVDVWDALIYDRPYRDAISKEKVLEMIQEQAGIHFDPQVVTAFVKLARKSFPDDWKS